MRTELKVSVGCLLWWRVSPGRQEASNFRTVNIPTRVVRVAAHTKGLRGSRNPHGSTFNPLNPPTIIVFPVQYGMVYSATDALTGDNEKGPRLKSTSWNKSKPCF